MAGADDNPPQEDAVARAIQQLSREEAAFFLDRLERAIRKRKLQLTGILIAMGIGVLGIIAAFYVYGSAPEGEFVGWVFLTPFGLIGLVLYVFGRAGERIARGGATATPEIRAKIAKVQADAVKAGAIKAGVIETDVVSKPPSGAKSAKPG
jgi:hypothetical protein